MADIASISAVSGQYGPTINEACVIDDYHTVTILAAAAVAVVVALVNVMLLSAISI